MKEDNEVNIRLFPHVFKKIGLAVICISFIVWGILAFGKIGFYQENLRLSKEILADLWIIGLFFLAFAKEKIEDERIKQIRNRVTTYTFYTGVIFTLYMSVLNIFTSVDKNNYELYKARDLIILTLFAYIAYFIHEKRK